MTPGTPNFIKLFVTLIHTVAHFFPRFFKLHITIARHLIGNCMGFPKMYDTISKKKFLAPASGAKRKKRHFALVRVQIPVS